MAHKLVTSATRPTVAWINLNHLQQNVKALKNHAKSDLFLAVIKTNAYGHGLLQVARTVIDAGADWLGITTLEEGVLLRDHGVKVPILLLSNSFEGQVADIIAYNLTASITSSSLAQKFSKEACKQDCVAHLHLKVDTGLHRFGVDPSDALHLCNECYSLPHIYWEGIFTHFSDADEGNWQKTEKQYKLFNQVVSILEKHGFFFPIKHVGGSTITLERPDMHCDMVRPGIALFGYYPSITQRSILKLNPVMQLSTRILTINHVSAHTSVGYGSHYLTKRDEKLAVLPVGLGDGYSRSLSNKGYVIVRNQRAKIVGKISLDQTIVDITNVSNVEEGDKVVLIGKMGDEEITADDIAYWMESIVDEVLACFTERIPRIYL